MFLNMNLSHYFMNKSKNLCQGESLFNEKNLGGHVEDYISDPNNPFDYPKKLEWVSVGQSFKKD